MTLRFTGIKQPLVFQDLMCLVNISNRRVLYLDYSVAFQQLSCHNYCQNIANIFFIILVHNFCTEQRNH